MIVSKKYYLKGSWLGTLFQLFRQISLSMFSILFLKKRPQSLYSGIIERGFPVLNPESPCTSCGLCEKNCPTGAIELEGKRAGNTLLQGQPPKAFFVSLNLCVQCGLCGDICPVEAVKTTKIVSVVQPGPLKINLNSPSV